MTLHGLPQCSPESKAMRIRMRPTFLRVRVFDHRSHMAAYSGPRARCRGQYAYHSLQSLSSSCTLGVITKVMTAHYTQEAWCQHLHVAEEKGKSFTASSPSCCGRERQVLHCPFSLRPAGLPDMTKWVPMHLMLSYLSNKEAPFP